MEKISKEVCEDLRLHIDENRLLEEWKDQAAMMLEYSIRLADARQAEDEAKAALSVVVAELDADIRNNPEEYGLQKATETSVVNAIPGCEEHQDAIKTLNSAKHTVRVLQAAVDALDHRKRTLQGMTELWLRQYYADPKSSAQPAEVREACSSGPPTKRIEGRKRRSKTKRTCSQ